MKLITTTDELAAFCKPLADTEFVAVDTEFMRERTYWPKLCLAQVAGPDDARRRGVAMIYQELNLALHLSAQENILLGAESASLGWVDGPDGRRAFTDRSAQSLVVLHLSPRDSLRLIHQHTRFTRRAEAAVGLAAQDDTGRVLSVMFQHRVGIARVLSVGLNRSHAQPGGLRSSEVFAKATLGY